MSDVVEEKEEEVSSLMPEQMIPALQAAQLLGVGHTKIAQLLKDTLPSVPSVLDHRVMLIKQSDVEALRDASKGITAREARKTLGISKAKMKFLIESGELPVRSHPLDKRQRIVDDTKYQELLAVRATLTTLPLTSHLETAHTVKEE